MTDDEIPSDPIFREAAEAAMNDPDLVEDVLDWNERMLQVLDDPARLNRVVVMAAVDLIAKHSGGIH